MANAKMVAGRFERWAKYRKMHAAITARLAQPNGLVQVTTYTKSTLYTHKHASWFSVDPAGVYVVSGKQKVAIHLCGIRLGTK